MKAESLGSYAACTSVISTRSVAAFGCSPRNSTHCFFSAG